MHYLNTCEWNLINTPAAWPLAALAAEPPDPSAANPLATMPDTATCYANHQCQVELSGQVICMTQDQFCVV